MLCTNISYRLHIVPTLDTLRIIHITFCIEPCYAILRQQIDISNQINLSTTYDTKLEEFIKNRP